MVKKLWIIILALVVVAAWGGISHAAVSEEQLPETQQSESSQQLSLVRRANNLVHKPVHKLVQGRFSEYLPSKRRGQTNGNKRLGLPTKLIRSTPLRKGSNGLYSTRTLLLVSLVRSVSGTAKLTWRRF
jgi:hypothetical protein